jgi:hypothetical protein
LKTETTVARRTLEWPASEAMLARRASVAAGKGVAQRFLGGAIMLGVFWRGLSIW